MSLLHPSVMNHGPRPRLHSSTKRKERLRPVLVCDAEVIWKQKKQYQKEHERSLKEPYAAYHTRCSGVALGCSLFSEAPLIMAYLLVAEAFHGLPFQFMSGCHHLPSARKALIPGGTWWHHCPIHLFSVQSSGVAIRDRPRFPWATKTPTDTLALPGSYATFNFPMSPCHEGRSKDM